MASVWCWSLALLSSIAYGQKAVEFTVLAKVPALSGTTIGYATDHNSIFLRDWEDYYHYSFQANTWNKLKFQNKLRTLEQGALKSLAFFSLNRLQADVFPPTSWITVSYLPTFEKILTISDQLEILDTEKLAVSYLKIEGGAPMGAGSAVWQEKIYLIGGLIVAPRKSTTTVQKWDIEFSKRLIAFDPALISFQELASLPSPRFAQGVFVNGMLYVLGGAGETKPLFDILRYDPQLNNWEALGELPFETVNYAMASSDELIFMLGTRGLAGYLGVYNTQTNQYIEYTTNVKWKNGAACVHDNKLYYFGGTDIDFPRWIARNMYVLDLTTLPK